MKINVNIPAGVSGDFEIAHYTKDTTDNRWPLYLLHTNEAYDNYTVLLKKGHSMPLMQDSEAEYNDHKWLWDNAKGDVLIGGLGIGMTHHILIENPNITSITIIENINTWEIPADSHWDIGWFDTWISDGDWGEYKTNMKEKYGPYITEINGWCW